MEIAFPLTGVLQRSTNSWLKHHIRVASIPCHASLAGPLHLAGHRNLSLEGLFFAYVFEIHNAHLGEIASQHLPIVTFSLEMIALILQALGIVWPENEVHNRLAAVGGTCILQPSLKELVDMVPLVQLQFSSDVTVDRLKVIVDTAMARAVRLRHTAHSSNPSG